MSFNYNVKLPLGYPVIDTFLGLKPHPTKCQATYVWIDGTKEYLRSKTRTFSQKLTHVEDFPRWNYDGSSTNQAIGKDSDVYLNPVAVFPDPFLGGNNCLVLCDTYDSQNKPTPTNTRYECAQIMKKIEKEKPWFGMEQEYLLLDRDGYPLGWPKNGFPEPQGPYYCGVGANKVFGRELVETHYRACLYSNIEIFGTNAEVAPGQWEFQIGPCEGVTVSDHLWIARYLLHRTAEQFGVIVTLDPKPPITMNNWNGAGCHTNFSTQKMRSEGGIKEIEAAIKKLELKHKEHIRLYDPHEGKDNLKRLVGSLETSSIDKFTYGVANRSSSVRIPRQVASDGKGYLEDRRPASNCDPYLVTGIIAKTVLID